MKEKFGGALSFRVTREVEELIERLATVDRRAAGAVDRSLFERGLGLYLKDGVLMESPESALALADKVEAKLLKLRGSGPKEVRPTKRETANTG